MELYKSKKDKHGYVQLQLGFNTLSEYHRFSCGDKQTKWWFSQSVSCCLVWALTLSVSSCFSSSDSKKRRRSESEEPSAGIEASCSDGDGTRGGSAGGGGLSLGSSQLLTWDQYRSEDWSTLYNSSYQTLWVQNQLFLIPWYMIYVLERPTDVTILYKIQSALMAFLLCFQVSSCLPRWHW